MEKKKEYLTIEQIAVESIAAFIDHLESVEAFMQKSIRELKEMHPPIEKEAPEAEVERLAPETIARMMMTSEGLMWDSTHISGYISTLEATLFEIPGAEGKPFEGMDIHNAKKATIRG